MEATELKACIRNQSGKAGKAFQEGRIDPGRVLRPR